MRYYYLVDDNMPYAICFSNKKALQMYAVANCSMAWRIYYNKADLPNNIIKVIGNKTCKDHNKKNDRFVMKDSFKDRS